MSEPEPEWKVDIDIADEQPGDILRLWMVERRRALISELRSLERLLGLPQSVPERTRAR